MATGEAEAAATRADVCVVGAGPAGLLTGLLLAKRGAKVVVLEAHETFDREFRGEVLQPSSARLLDQVGLLDYIRSEPHLRLTSGRLLVHGKVAGTFTFDAISSQYPYAIWMPQPVFLAALHRLAERLPSFECRMGARVTGLIEEHGAVAGVRGMRHGRSPFEVRADVVVGADGRHSAARRLGRFDMQYEHHDFDIVWFVIDPPPGWPKTIHFSVGSTPYLLLPKYPDRIQVGLVLARDAWHHWMKEGAAVVAERLRRLDPLFSGFAGAMRGFTSFFPLPAVIGLVRDWARDGLLLIGDSAHTMSPAGAIGVNVALSTAAVAVQEIFPRLGRGPIPAPELARVQQVREPDVRELHSLQRKAGAMLLASGDRKWLVRNIVPRVLPWVIRLGILPRIQRRMFFGAPLPPLDPAFAFGSEEAGTRASR